MTCSHYHLTTHNHHRTLLQICITDYSNEHPIRFFYCVFFCCLFVCCWMVERCSFWCRNMSIEIHRKWQFSSLNRLTAFGRIVCVWRKCVNWFFEFHFQWNCLTVVNTQFSLEFFYWNENKMIVFNFVSYVKNRKIGSTYPSIDTKPESSAKRILKKFRASLARKCAAVVNSMPFIRPRSSTGLSNIIELQGMSLSGLIVQFSFKWPWIWFKFFVRFSSDKRFIERRTFHL